MPWTAPARRAALAITLAAWIPASYGCLSFCGPATGTTGAAPTTAAGQLALTRPGFTPYGFSPEQERMDRLAIERERAWLSLRRPARDSGPSEPPFESILLTLPPDPKPRPAPREQTPEERRQAEKERFREMEKMDRRTRRAASEMQRGDPSRATFEDPLDSSARLIADALNPALRTPGSFGSDLPRGSGGK
jgi:hypothetical protein